MARKRLWKVESRGDFSDIVDGDLSENQVAIGAIMRMADSLELIVKSKTDLEAEVSRQIANRDYWMGLYDAKERSNATLRGHITRLKNKIKEMEAGDE